jgi:hypothetical protein
MLAIRLPPALLGRLIRFTSRTIRATLACNERHAVEILHSTRLGSRSFLLLSEAALFQVGRLATACPLVNPKHEASGYPVDVGYGLSVAYNSTMRHPVDVEQRSARELLRIS